MTPQEKCALLSDTMKGLTEFQQVMFMACFAAALAVHVKDESWKSCLETASKSVPRKI